MQRDIREHLLKRVTILFCVLAVIVVAGTYAIPYAENAIAQEKEKVAANENREKEKLLSMSGVELIEYANESKNKAVESQELSFSLPLGCKGKNIQIEMDDLKRYVLEIPYADENYLYDWSVTGDTSILSNIEYAYSDRLGTVTLDLNIPYECETDYDSDTFTMKFMTPKQIYGKVIVIDAACGGEDTGISIYNVDEKNINLDIVLELKKYLDDLTDVGIFYTRTTDSSMSDTERIQYAQELGADLVVSVKMNHTPSGMVTEINGTQATYQSGNELSEWLADTIQQGIVTECGTSDKGTKKMEEDNLYYDAGMPVVVIEPGFINNKGDLELLSQNDVQKKVAEVIFEGIEEYLERN